MTKPPAGLPADRKRGPGDRGARPDGCARSWRHSGQLIPYVYTRGYRDLAGQLVHACRPISVEKIEVYVDDATGQVTQVWTGYQVQWTMARGYPGAFGRRGELPVRLAAALPRVPASVSPVPVAPRPGSAPVRWTGRPGGASRCCCSTRSMLLGFSVSLAFFNHADLGMSVPTVYPFMVYLLVRMLLLAFGIGRPQAALRVPSCRRSWLVDRARLPRRFSDRSERDGLERDRRRLRRRDRVGEGPPRP